MVDVWQWTPFTDFLLLLAAWSRARRTLYEGGGIDGASAWQEAARVTLPLMLPTSRSP